MPIPTEIAAARAVIIDSECLYVVCFFMVIKLISGEKVAHLTKKFAPHLSRPEAIFPPNFVAL